MARRRRKQGPGLLEIAATSDWKVGGAMALVCVVGAAFVIPALFASSPILAGMGGVFSTLAWIMAAAFGLISVVKLLKKVPQRVTASGTTGSPGVAVSAGDRALFERHQKRTGRVSVELIVPQGEVEVGPDEPLTWSFEVLDRVEWKRFENLCREFYREKGIKAVTTRLGADGGVDIRLFQDSADPERMTSIVQCKALAKQVGVAMVRELRGVMAHEGVESAFFMAPNGFTDDAVAFARTNRIHLLDGKSFLHMIQRLPDEAQQRLLAFATEGDWTSPTCPACGAKMVERPGKGRAFWGCSTFPRCRQTMPMRARRS